VLLNGKIDDDPDSSSPDSPNRTWIVWMALGCCFPLYLLFSALRNAGAGTAAGCFGLAIAYVVRLHWELKNRPWFWVVVSAIVFLHLAMLLLIPWPNLNYTLPIVLPIGIIDALAISFAVNQLRRGWGDRTIKCVARPKCAEDIEH
jgi:hypothetical protein